jgi:hypothetical protein
MLVGKYVFRIASPALVKNARVARPRSWWREADRRTNRARDRGINQSIVIIQVNRCWPERVDPELAEQPVKVCRSYVLRAMDAWRRLVN